jgi:hypothetical protein
LSGIDDLLGLSDGNAEDGELNMSDFMLNNTSSALASFGTASNSTMNNGMTGMFSGSIVFAFSTFTYCLTPIF